MSNLNAKNPNNKSVLNAGRAFVEDGPSAEPLLDLPDGGPLSSGAAGRNQLHPNTGSPSSMRARC